MIGRFCYQNICLERPSLLLLIVPIFIILIFIMFRTFVKFRNKEEKKHFKAIKKGLRISMIITRTIMFFLILIAFANPFTTIEVTTEGDLFIKLLTDNSDSMKVFDQGTLNKVRNILEGTLPIELSQIGSSTRSSLGDGIFKEIEGNDNLLIITDGNNLDGKTLADVGIYASLSNSRLFSINLKTVKNDASVEIIGPAETIENTLNRFKIKVNTIGAKPAFTLQVYIDDRLEFSGNNINEKEILKSFSRGYHKITAKILLDDFYEENNIFYKTVKTVPSPRVLFVSKENSPLEEGLNNIYDLTVRSTIPDNIIDYQAIIINNIPYSEIKSKVDDLTGHLLDGNGIVFIGGHNSFGKGGYKGSLVESMLPVTVGTGKIIAPLKHNIIIVLDVSESFSDYSYKVGGSESVLDLGKSLTLKMIEGFRDDIGVGVVAFATLAQIVAEPRDLKDSRAETSAAVRRLGGGEGTLIDQGLLMADYALQGVKGSKTIILISDGKMGHNKMPHGPLNVAQKISKKGTKIYTVGLPSVLYDVDINRPFMKKIASIGNGFYLEPNEFQNLFIFFGKPEAKESVFSGSANLAIMDTDHFITENLNLKATLTGVNFVVPKLGARSLIFTSDGNPIVNSWNFGLGRVITLATDDGREWATSLLLKQNSELLTRIINYAVGNPEKDKEILIDIHDGSLGDPIPVTIKSDKYPVSKGITFTKESEDIYRGELVTKDSGYFQLFDSIVAVNNPREYYKLGFNDDLLEMVQLSGGKMLDIDDKFFVKQIQSFSKRVETIRKDLRFYPILLLLIVFILELIIRKIYENKKYKVK